MTYTVSSGTLNSSIPYHTILDDWSGRNVSCNPVLIIRCYMAVQLQPEATGYSSVRYHGMWYVIVGGH